MSNMTTVSSSRYIKTYCNPMILRALLRLSRGGQRLLLILLSKLSINKPNFLNTSVRLPFGEYCAAIQQTYDDKHLHGAVRNAFYDLKKHCDCIVAKDSVYSEAAQEIIVAFTKAFYLELREAKIICIPQTLLAVERGEKMPNYTLTMAIYYRKHISGKNKVTLSIRELIKLCGGVHTDFENKQKNWRSIYVMKISNALLTLKELGIITKYRYKLGRDEGIDPNEYNKCFDDNIKDPVIFSRRRERVENYYKFTRYYRTYLDVDVVIMIGEK